MTKRGFLSNGAFGLVSAIVGDDAAHATMRFVLTAPIHLSEYSSIPTNSTGTITRYDADHQLLTFDVTHCWGNTIVLDEHDTEPEVWAAIQPLANPGTINPSMTDPPFARVSEEALEGLAFGRPVASKPFPTLRLAAAAVLIALGLWQAGECTVAAAASLEPVIELVVTEIMPLLEAGG